MDRILLRYGTLKTFVLMLTFLTYFMCGSLTCCENRETLDVLYERYEYLCPQILENDPARVFKKQDQLTENERYWYVRGKLDILSELIYKFAKIDPD